MNNRILVKATASENCISFRTISRNKKSPQRFLILRDELIKLETQASVISHDIWSFAILRRNTAVDTLEIQFTWLSGGTDRLYGWDELVTLPYTSLVSFAKDSALEGGPKEWKALSVDISKRRPKFVFDSRGTLHAVLNNGVIRRKLFHFLQNNFRWPDSEQIRFFSDFVPYSFTFQEICNGQPVMTGGLILHGQEDLNSAYYSIHT